MTDVHGHLIDGRFVTSETERENVDPTHPDRVIGRYATGDAGTVDSAVAAARAAAPGWAAAPVSTRSQVLASVSGQIAERADELGELLAREEGKPIAEARGEVMRASQLFSFFAGEALRNAGELLGSVRPGISVEMTHEPVGVVAAITPWNFPIAIPAWKLAPALAFGNAVVMKPADITPGCAWELASMLTQAGLPDGVFNLVMGSGSTVGAALARHPGIDAVTFTGSAGTGHRIASDAAEDGKRVQCEMGGKNPLVVLGDADLEAAVEAAVNGGFYSNGERCTASSRIIVTEDVYDSFTQRLVERLPKLTVGDPLETSTVVGPLASKEQREKVVGYLDEARAAGLEIYGGEVPDLPGWFVAPAVVIDPDQAHVISREEVFGPVVSMVRARDYEHALDLANDTEFGLSAGIFTSSLASATHFKRNAQVGMVMVNAPTAGVDPHASFGGRKSSSYGYREQGAAAREFFTLHKTAYVAS